MIESIPHHSLGNFPTPVQRLSNLERALGFESLWIKRDDPERSVGRRQQGTKTGIYVSQQHIRMEAIGKGFSQSVRRVLIMFGQQQSTAKQLDST